MTLLSADTLWLFIAMLSAGACAGFTAGSLVLAEALLLYPFYLLFLTRWAWRMMLPCI